ncbi:diguanylate cyclase domain-containing protein [Mycolicibacterium aichiense]|uniref:diguanylate cyclase domain-containing protein n=1 Tax=Mycolicibacterium aichiense TaxID=1799 RepID=UPI003D67C2E5
MSDTGALGDEHRLRQLIDKLPAMVAYWDVDLRNVVANDAHRPFFGKTPAEIRGMHITELLVGDLGEASLPYVYAAMAGEDQIFEKTLTDHNGVTRHVQASYLPDMVDGQVRGLYVQVADVTARVEAERARDDAQRLFEISMDNAPFGKAVFSTDGRALYINSALRELLGIRPHDDAVIHYYDGVHPDDSAVAEQDWRELLSGSVDRIATEVRYVRSDGAVIFVHRAAVLAPGAHGGADVVIAQLQDITARKDAEAELAHRAVTDPLTGLHNRHSLVARIAEHRTAHPGDCVAALFIDLDGFKRVNDSHGHAAGDAVLEAAAGRLAAAVVSPNAVYRLGGDEFVVLVVDDVRESAVEQLAQDVWAAVSGAYPVDGSEVTLTASVGCASSRTADAAELIREADIDMYRHKAQRQQGDQRLSSTEIVARDGE